MFVDLIFHSIAMDEINIFTLRAFKLMVDILINVLKNLKGNDKFDGIQYLLVSINTIKMKLSPVQRAIAIKSVETPRSFDQTLSNYFKTRNENSKIIFSANNLNTLWIAQFLRRTLAEFVFESVNVNPSMPQIKHERALKYETEWKDEETYSSTSTSSNKSSDNNETLKEPATALRQKKVKTKKKQQPTYKCVLCEKRYLQRKPLLKHFSRFHVGFCSECGVNTGSNIEDIIEHKKIKHSKKYPYICGTCGEVFSRNQQFQVHLTIHERDIKNAKVITCPQCSETFTKKYLYRKHLRLTKHQDRSMICELCGSQFNDSVKLNQHIKRVHNGISRKCQYCEQTFDQKCNLDRHMRLHTQVTKTFICEHCGDAYYTNEALKQHCIAVHERRPKVACTICQKEFKNSRSLRIHIASHSDQRPFSCPQCPQAFKLKSHLSRHEKSVHGQLPARKKIERLQPNEKGELVTVIEPQSYHHRRSNEKLINFQPFSNDSLFYSQGSEKEFQPNTINSAVCTTGSENIISEQLNDVQQFQMHQTNANISDYVIDNLDIFHNCDAQHQGQTDFAFNETSSMNQQCYTENRHLNELDHNNWTNFLGNGNFDDKSSKMPLIELNSNEYMQISVPPMMQYQNAWHSDSTQMDISAAQSSQKVTYNNIGNILTNLELLGNNSNFDASNFEIISSNRDQQSKVILNDVNPSTSHHNGMSYFNIQPLQQPNFIDLQANNLQGHTITDISNTYVTETQRNHLHQTRFFQNRDIIGEDLNKSCTGTSNDDVDPNGHQTTIVFPSLTDYLPSSSTHGFN